MQDFFGHSYDVGDFVYYVVLAYSRRLHAKIGQVVKINSTSLTININKNLVVIQRPRRHVNLTKLQDNEVDFFKAVKKAYEY